MADSILLGRARRGASGALYPRSAIAGLNSDSRFLLFRTAPAKWRWRLGLARRSAMNPVRSGRKQR